MEELGVNFLTNFVETDPELIQILERFIYGEIYHQGTIDDELRQLITLVVLTANQTFEGFKSEVEVALKVGVTPIAIKEAIYNCVPYIGFPKVLSALKLVNEVYAEQKVTLPLQNQARVQEEERYELGNLIQYPLYGDRVKQNNRDLPESHRELLPRYLTEFGFGDFHTRSGLTIKMRELLMLCVLCTLGGCEIQIKSHANGNLRVGNSIETMISAVTHCLPYIGFPRTLNSIALIKQAHIE